MTKIIILFCSFFIISSCVEKNEDNVSSINNHQSTFIKQSGTKTNETKKVAANSLHRDQKYKNQAIALTSKTSKLIINTILEHEGLTDTEKKIIDSIQIEVIYSESLFATTSVFNKKPTIKISTAYAELFAVLISNFSLYEVSNPKSCKEDFRLFYESYTKLDGEPIAKLNTIRKTSKCNKISNTEGDKALGLIGFLAIPLAHEIAHHLNGDLYKARDEDFGTKFFLELNADHLSVKLLSRTQVLLYGLPLFLFLEDTEFSKSQHYLPPLCRAAFIFDKYSRYYPELLMSPTQYVDDKLLRFRQAPIMKTLFKKMIENKAVTESLECPATNVYKGINRWG